MSQQIIAILTPVILALVTALAGIAVVAITQGKQLVINWIKSHTDANQQAVIDKVAAEAYAYAEKWVGEYGGGKLQTAIEYAAKEFAKRGIDVDAVKIAAAVQAAWEQYGKK